MHALEQSPDGTQTAFVNAGSRVGPAWHRLGESKENPATVAEAMESAHMNNWNVRKVPLYGQREDKHGVSGRTILMPDLYGTVRTNPWTGDPEGIGVVGRLWKPFQNEQLAEGAQAIVDEFGANIETAGSMNGGKHVFVALRLPEGIKVGDGDACDVFLIGSTAHNGDWANRYHTSVVRPVCWNTYLAGLRAAKSIWSFRHSGDLEGKLAVAREGLKISWKYSGEMEKVLNGMLQDPFSDEEMQGLLKELMPDPKSEAEGWVQRVEGQRNSVMDLFKNADTCDYGRGTKYAAWNAVTEYTDWLRPGNPERRAKEALGIGVNVHLKPQAWKALAGKAAK